MSEDDDYDTTMHLEAAGFLYVITDRPSFAVIHNGERYGGFKTLFLAHQFAKKYPGWVVILPDKTSLQPEGN